MANYKLPACWLGKFFTVPTLKERAPGDDRPFSMDDVVLTARPATEDDIQPGCTCTEHMQAFWCMTGHILECHAGKTCAEAKCSHLARYE